MNTSCNQSETKDIILLLHNNSVVPTERHIHTIQQIFTSKYYHYLQFYDQYFSALGRFSVAFVLYMKLQWNKFQRFNLIVTQEITLSMLSITNLCNQLIYIVPCKLNIAKLNMCICMAYTHIIIHANMMILVGSLAFYKHQAACLNVNIVVTLIRTDLLSLDRFTIFTAAVFFVLQCMPSLTKPV